MITIRPERPNDADTLFQVYLQAFGRLQEAALVDSLRENHGLLISLVAISDGSIVGGVAFSPVTLEPAASNLRLAALAPLAVLPAFQDQGIGSSLIGVGLRQCREKEIDAVFLIGEPEFYSRFGFVAALDFGIRCELKVPEAFWLVKELAPQVLSGLDAVVKHRPEFKGLEYRTVMVS